MLKRDADQPLTGRITRFKKARFRIGCERALISRLSLINHHAVPRILFVKRLCNSLCLLLRWLALPSYQECWVSCMEWVVMLLSALESAHSDDDMDRLYFHRHRSIQNSIQRLIVAIQPAFYLQPLRLPQSMRINPLADREPGCHLCSVAQ